MPPARADNLPVQGGRIWQLELEPVNKGEILVDSGSTAHVEDSNKDGDDDP